MTLEITPDTSKPAPWLEIGEKPGDTRRSVASSRPPTRRLAIAVAATQVLTPGYVLIEDLFAPRDMTAYRDEETIPVDGGEVLSTTTPEEEARLSAAETANQSRLELLAREYVAGQLSTEEQARLAIVSERVRMLIPRVTVRDFEELERIGKELEELGAEDTARRRRIESL